MSDEVTSPAHYTSHPSGVECIEVIKSMRFVEGAIVKYVWRRFDKGTWGSNMGKAEYLLDHHAGSTDSLASGSIGPILRLKDWLGNAKAIAELPDGVNNRDVLTARFALAMASGIRSEIRFWFDYIQEWEK